MTSRDALAGLVARDGAVRVPLGLLGEPLAIQLLRSGMADRETGEDAALAEIARLCARLPLALRVAAERAAGRPDQPLAELAQELSSATTRLEGLSAAGDPQAAVRTVLSLSYRHLDPQGARTFRALGLLPGIALDTAATAALLGASQQEARTTLDRLAAAHLVEAIDGQRFTMHDLLRAYAAELGRAVDDPEQALAGMRRLVQAELARCAAMVRSVNPAWASDLGDLPNQHGSAADPAAATAWLSSERASLVTLAGHVAQSLPDLTIRLAEILWPQLYANAAFSDGHELMHHALRAALATGDRSAEANARRRLGAIYWAAGRPEEAVREMELSLAAVRQSGDRAGTARCLNNLGMLIWLLGRVERTVDYLEEALSIDRQLGNKVDQVSALSNLTLVAWRSGRYTEALSLVDEALQLSAELGDLTHEAGALNNKGVVLQRLGRHNEAVRCHRRALELAQTAEARLDEIEANTDLGLALTHLGRATEGLEFSERALLLAQEIGDSGAQAEALHGLGVAMVALGRPLPAEDAHSKALDLARTSADKGRELINLNGLGEANLARNRADRAATTFEGALTVTAQLGGDPFEQARALRGLGQAERELGHLRAAAVHLDTAQMILDQLISS